MCQGERDLPASAELADALFFLGDLSDHFRSFLLDDLRDVDHLVVRNPFYVHSILHFFLEKEELIFLLTFTSPIKLEKSSS